MDDYGFAVRGDLSVTLAKYGHVTFTISVWYALHFGLGLR